MKYIKIGVLFITTLFIFNIRVNASNANTLAGFREELATQKRNYNAANANANKTKTEINSAKNNVFSSQDEIKKNQAEIDKSKIEIETLNIEIAKKDENIKNYLSNLQEMSGNNIYLEYLLDSEDYADLVYRYAIIEQVVSYSKDQITSYEEKIVKNKELQVSLAKREIELKEKIDKLEKDIISLGNQYEKLVEITLDVKTELDATQKYIDYLVSIGCGENQDITACIGAHGDTGFIRPVPYGTITSYFGYRTHPVTGARQSWHGAIDIGGMKEGSNVYSAANGTVAKIVKKSSCGGNMVYVHHNISGKLYTTAYYHLLEIKVSLGDMVTRNSVIGTAGGGYGTPWDKCSTGVHLHFVIATGWYGTTCSGDCYLSPTTFSQVKAVNPRNYISFPDKYVWFSGR